VPFPDGTRCCTRPSRRSCGMRPGSRSAWSGSPRHHRPQAGGGGPGTGQRTARGARARAHQQLTARSPSCRRRSWNGSTSSRGCASSSSSSGAARQRRRPGVAQGRRRPAHRGQPPAGDQCRHDAEEMIGRTAHDLFPAEIAERYDQDDREVLALRRRSGSSSGSSRATVARAGTRRSRRRSRRGRRGGRHRGRGAAMSGRKETEELQRRFQEELDLLVRERTAQLERANAALIEEIRTCGSRRGRLRGGAPAGGKEAGPTGGACPGAAPRSPAPAARPGQPPRPPRRTFATAAGGSRRGSFDLPRTLG